MPPRAKAKIRAERRAAQKKLEENGAPLEVRQSDEKQIRRVRTIDTGELKNVIAATVQRVYANEFHSTVNYINAREHYANLIVKILKYGAFDDDGYLRMTGGIPMRDHDYRRIPRCRQHRRPR